MNFREMSRIVNYIYKDIIGSIEDEEKEILDIWRSHFSLRNEIYKRVVDKNFFTKKTMDEKDCDVDDAFLKFEKRIRTEKHIDWIKITGYVAAIVAIFVGVILVWSPLKENKLIATKAKILPGTANVTLTLSDGRDVLLNKCQLDTLLLDMHTKIRIVDNQLEYPSEILEYGIDESREIMYQTLTIPRNGEYRLKLSDGTRVYLNAQSSLKFPIVFNDQERRVILKGEAYFEVAQNNQSPFIVETDCLNVKVYGTSFNVNMNALHSMQIVLVSGKIGVTSKLEEEKEYFLKPSQMAEFRKDGRLIEIREVRTNLYTAWKDGFFYFENERLESIMHTLSLWYDVEFSFSDPNIKEYCFTAHMEKYDNIVTILDAISRSVKVGYSINGNMVTFYN